MPQYARTRERLTAETTTLRSRERKLDEEDGVALATLTASTRATGLSGRLARKAVFFDSLVLALARNLIVRESCDKNVSKGVFMSLGRASSQSELFDGVADYCESALSDDSIYSFLHLNRERLFPDDLFADLYSSRGRKSVPPSILAVVMVLQRLEGLSDYEAIERLQFDARWGYATGIGGFKEGAVKGFVRTVLVYTRERLRRSEDPDRIFRVVLEAGKKAGLVGRKRVLDSTALYDSVSTMDTITLIRSAIRGVLRSLEADVSDLVRSKFTSDDDYATTSKPQIDWADPEAQAGLIDSRARDGFSCLESLKDQVLASHQREAIELLATVLGQDLEVEEEGRYQIVRGVAKDRVISTVDPEARHGHKTEARSFDGYKGHVAIDPESEVITPTLVTPGNAGDGSVAEKLVEDLLDELGEKEDSEGERREVFGDGAYGTASFQAHLGSERPRMARPYRRVRPIVERKIAHCVRKRHGDRNARVRGLIRVAADFNILGAATNLARMARIGLRFQGGSWSIPST